MDLFRIVSLNLSRLFDETVTPIANRVRVIAPDGKRISGSVTSSDDTITIKVTTEIDQATVKTRVTVPAA